MIADDKVTAGFKPLFDGKTMEGWNNPYKWGEIEIVDGEIHLKGDNKYRITCKGNRITIEVNGVVVTDIEDDKDASGVIGIQHHGEKGQTYKFRNLRIKELD